MRISDRSSDVCSSDLTLAFIEAMHLLPQSFEFRRSTPPPKGRLSEQRHSSSQPLFGSFRKACRTSSRGRLFRFEARRDQGPTSSCRDRKSVVSGKSVSVRVDLGGLRINKKNKK